MGRPLRIEYPGALYHVTSRGNERRNIFLDDADRRKLLGILDDYHDRYGILIHCYVLMGNHYHLVVETPQGNLVKVMHGINSRYTGYFNRKYTRVGHLFQGRYRAILVGKDPYLLEVSRYVHLNPVRVKVVNKPEQYAWSSYPGYIAKGKEIPWVEYSWILSQFGLDRKTSKKRYREFVSKAVDESTESPFGDLYGQGILGKAEFIEKTKGLLEGRQVSQEIVGRNRLRQTAKPEDILSAVAAAFNTEIDTLTGKGGGKNTAKKVAIYAIKRYSGLGNQEIGTLFGGMHYSAVSKSSARLETEMAADKALGDLVEEILSNVKT
jgi:putative transposase